MRGNTSAEANVDYDVVARTNGRVPAAAVAAAVPGGSRELLPKSHMTYALASLVGAWPLAIVAIINARSVTSKWAVGDREGARRASERARRWATASWIVGALVVLIMVTAS